MLKTELFYVEGEAHAFTEMENYSESCKLFMLLSQQNNCVIQKYYWVSKMDKTHLELIEPKIFDAYTFHCDISGTLEDVKNTLKEFEEREQEMISLSKMLYTPITEAEIQEWASKVEFMVD